MSKEFEEAKKVYESYGVDVENALSKIKEVPISIHCWQGDDVVGLDGAGKATGGIQTTGNYPGAATTFEELKKDIAFAFSLIPGKKRLNLHASYALLNGEDIDRDKYEPRHFKGWVDFAKKQNLDGIDFNPTMFSHKMVKDNLTLSSPDKKVRQFWIDHCKACIKIAEYFATQFNSHSLLNIWIPDGFKDVPADRLTPRLRLKESLDKILKVPYDKDKVKVSVESKVFGIGLESYTVGSNEFYQNYASRKNIIPLLDNGHYHPLEYVSDKIPALLPFYKNIALHITRGVRWDSDHVVLFEDELKEICKEIVRNDALDRVYIGLDYFDASINRIVAWVVGARNVEKALLWALCLPNDRLKKLQDENKLTELMVLQEELKDLPFSAIYNEYLSREGLIFEDETWLDKATRYGKKIIRERSK